MKIPSPQDLGLPEKYEEWRPNQEHLINVIITDQKRTTAACAPTGFGKTGAVVAAAVLSQKPTCIVTANNGLLNQYMDEFEPMGMVALKGRRNYQCDLKPDDDHYTCDEGYNARCPYKGTVACPASKAEMKAALSSLVVTNYDKWTSSKKFGQGMSHFEQVIFDEAHEMPDALARAMQVVLHFSEIEEDLGLDFPEGSSNLDDMWVWKRWSSQARQVAEEMMKAAKLKLLTTSDPKPSWVRHYTHMRNLVRNLGIVSTASAKDWVVDQIKEGYQFDPIRPGRYAEHILLLRVPRIVMLSATLTIKTPFMCGMGRDTFSFQEFDSDFDPARGPIYWIPTMAVKGLGTDLSMLWLRLDQIAAKRRDVKGIVHSISHARKDEIKACSRFADSMLINPRGEPPTRMIAEYKAAGAGTILVSPSIGMGYDFPDDDCRWQFVSKIPFEPPSKIQKARQHEDKEYVYHRAWQKLVQMFGRDVRSKRDWSQRFIGDDQMSWFQPRYGHLAPRSFHAVYKVVSILPQPLNLN